MKLIIVGAPGAGKGTQAEIICQKLSIPAISTGNLIRAAMKKGTEIGLQVKQYMESGELVPDDIVIAMLRERLTEPDCSTGYILDGFPRNVAQAHALDQMGIVIDKVIDLEVDDDTIERRLSGRRICQGCGASYHTEFKPSARGEVCDKCGDALITRKDDEPATVRRRLRVYHEQTEPLKEYYLAAGKLIVVKGQELLEDTTKRTLAALEA